VKSNTIPGRAHSEVAGRHRNGDSANLRDLSDGAAMRGDAVNTAGAVHAPRGCVRVLLEARFREKCRDWGCGIPVQRGCREGGLASGGAQLERG